MAWWRRKKPLRWTIVTAAPKGEAGQLWGDTHFAHDLADALTSLDQLVRVVPRSGAHAPARAQDDVVVVLRGLRRVTPVPGNASWLLWVISHPELIEPGEIEEFDLTFAASATWQRGRVIPLLQATNPSRFSPDLDAHRSGVLFVGNTRGEFRPVVRDAIEAGIPIEVYGHGWEEFIDSQHLRGESLSNSELPHAYRTAAVVLNDHWADMAREGFLSNRLFDAVASGAAVVSDPAAGLSDVFGDCVSVYHSPEELRDALDRALALSAAERLACAERMAQEHSFLQRAQVMVDHVSSLRGVS